MKIFGLCRKSIWFYNLFFADFSASPILKKLHDGLAQLLVDKETLQQRLSTELSRSQYYSNLTLDAKSLSLRWTPGLSHIVHVSSKDAKTLRSHQDAIPISASKSTQSFQLPVLPSYQSLKIRNGHT
jgi:hypothetical protein